MADQTKRIVQVGADKGWLRLRWTYQGKRYHLTLGLPDSNVNKTVAQQKANQIELDLEISLALKAGVSFTPISYVLTTYDFLKKSQI